MPDDARKALEFARSLLTDGYASHGYCMCGSPVDAHGFGDGHTPVDAFDYHIDHALVLIDRALAA